MRVIVEGKRRPEVYEGLWECLDCKRVVELERGDNEYVVRVNSGGLCEERTLVMECAICGGETTWFPYEPSGQPKGKPDAVTL